MKDHCIISTVDRHYPICISGSQLSVSLERLLMSKQMKKDIQMLSTVVQTSAIESFHSLLNHYAPKMMHYHYESHLSR